MTNTVRFICAIAALGMLAGCAKMATTSSELVLPSGDKGYSITCGGIYGTQYCYERAGEYCPNGYDVITGNEQQNIMVGMYGGAANTNYTILIRCK